METAATPLALTLCRALAASTIATALATTGALCAQSGPYKHPDGTPHHYLAVPVAGGITWADASRAAAEAGGYLATITSSYENAIVWSLVDDPQLWSQDPTSGEWDGPWIGGVQAPGSAEPAGGFGWSELEAWSHTEWTAGQPDDDGGADRVCFGGATSGRTPTWSDRPAGRLLDGYVVEFSGPFVRRTLGVIESTGVPREGYTLFNPLRSKETYLVDTFGRAVQTWTSDYTPGTGIYLRQNGNLLRSGLVDNRDFVVGGAGGIVEEFDWQNQVVWSFTYSSSTHCLHHDLEELPNGNILMIAWEKIAGPQAIAGGRDPNLLPEGEVWPDKVIEVDPGGNIVWEWRAWDHVIQDFDPSKANYGNVAQHPELIDLNYTIHGGEADWMHSNAVAYNPALDQVMLSVRSFDELWVIDHSTTTAEAAGHAGGRSGHGGDLLYRWGNPLAYRAGTAADQRLFKQHDAHWIPSGLPGAGNILVFNNGTGRPGGDASTVDEIVPPPIDRNGNYRSTGGVWGPSNASWTFAASPPTSLYSTFVSGAQRLPDGNTLVCAGWLGTILEVTPQSQVVWSYRVPLVDGAPGQQGREPSSSFVFRSPHYGPSFAGFTGHTLTPGAPIESYSSILLADGSTVARDARVGSSVALTLKAPSGAGLPYVVMTSATAGTMPLDLRHVRVGMDWILVTSLTNSAPGVFRDYFGALDDRGAGAASLDLPPVPGLAGLSFHTAFVVVDPAAPSGIGQISNTVTVRVVP